MFQSGTCPHKSPELLKGRDLIKGTAFDFGRDRMEWKPFVNSHYGRPSLANRHTTYAVRTRGSLFLVFSSTLS